MKSQLAEDTFRLLNLSPGDKQKYFEQIGIV